MSEIFGDAEAFNVGSFMAEAVNEGLSGRAALSAFRDAGMRMSNQSFRQMYAEVQDAIGGSSAIAGLPADAIPPADAYGTWAMGEGGRYSSFVTSFVRRTGERDVEQRFYTYTTDEPHTPGEAVDAARDWYTSDDRSADSFGSGLYQGSVVTSMVRTRSAG